MLNTIVSDLLYSFRKIAKHKVFTLIVISTMSLAIGMNTAIFSVINTLFLDPLPYSDPNELVQVENNIKPLNLEKLPVSVPEFADFERQTRVFSNVGIYTSWDMNLNAYGGNDAERLSGAQVSGSLFDVFNVAPAMGRPLRADDDNQGVPKVVVVSYGFWQERFSKNPNIIGQSLVLDGISYMIVGVMPKGFYFPDRQTRLWAPITFMPADFVENERGDRSYNLYARLKPGLGIEQARAAMGIYARQQSDLHPADYPSHGLSISVTPLKEAMVGDARKPLMILLIAAVLVLLIACVNVANLMAARATTWRREVDMRIALGATRARMFAQFFCESLLLSLIAGAFGVLLSYAAKGLIVATIAGDTFHASDVVIDGRALSFVFLICVITGIVFGATLALQVNEENFYESLCENSSTGNRSRHRYLDVLIVVEVCFSLVLLVGAGVMIKSLYKLQNVEPGFDGNNVLTAKLYLPTNKYNLAQRRTFYTGLLQRMSGHPGVVAAGVVNQLPLDGGASDRTFMIQGRQGQSAQPDVEVRYASSDYFKAMRVALIKGREFLETDDDNAAKVLIINQAMAKMYWPGEDAVGKRMAYFAGPGENPEWREIVGVVGDVHHFGLNLPVKPEVYVPYKQEPRAFMSLVVRTESDPLAMVSAIRSDVRDMDKNQAVYDIKPMGAVVGDSIQTQRFSAILLGSFAGFALFLATIGLYGVLSYLVSQRTRELGIRIALGAQKSNIFSLILRKGMLLLLIGVCLGLVGSFAWARLLSSLIYGVSATDPAIFALVTTILVAVSVVACVIPAARAISIDPVVALKYD
jgi:putative ABC transport system permease protein